MIRLALAATFVLAACTAIPAHPASPRPGSPQSSSTVSVLPSGSGTIDLTSLSGRIVFDNFQDIWSVNADGTDLRRLTRSPWSEFDPSWSPDGRFIAYRSEPHDYPQLWVMNADGTGQHPLTRDGGFPDWSPHGIAYAPGGGTSGRSSIAIINADGSGQRRVPHTDYGELPSWSPDGTRIAFSSSDTVSGRRVFVVDVATGKTTFVADGTSPEWLDDHTLIIEGRREAP
jgi:Tol biopolymer transport system component